MRTTKEKLVEELQFLCDTLQGSTPKEPELILEDLRFSTGYLARTAELVADAEYYLNVRRGEVAHENSELTATILREVSAKDCATEQRIYRLAERINATLTHRIDSLRSQLSYEKMLAGVERQTGDPR